MNSASSFSDNIKYTLTLAAFALLAIATPGVRDVLASSIVADSSSYTASAITALNTTISNSLAQSNKCPKGRTCSQNPDAMPGVTARTQQGSKLELTYDSNKKEALLTATFKLTVNGGKNGVYLYAYPMISFRNSAGQGYYVNGQRNLPLVPMVKMATTTDVYGQVTYRVAPGHTENFTAVGTVDPKTLFAGTYYATVDGLLGYQTATSSVLSIINVNSDNTNSKTIVGETSPYITSISPIHANVGNTVTITGQRLGGSLILIDGASLANLTAGGSAPIAGSIDGTMLGFKIPSVSAGWHILTVSNINGVSNGVGLEVLTPVATTTACYTFTTNMTVGSTGADVIALQSFLVNNGYLSSVYATGYYGAETQSAVSSYQTSVGMPATGFVGPLTIAKLNSSCSGGGIATTTQTVTISNTSAVKGPLVTNSNGTSQSQNVTFNFTLTAGNNPVFISTSVTDSATLAPNSSLVFAAKGYLVPAKGSLNVNLPSTADTADHFYIAPGTSRQFNYTGMLSNAFGVSNGANIVKIIAINYGTTGATNLSAYSIVSGLDNLNILSDITGSAQTASVTINGTPTLALTYDSNQKESALTAKFNVTVNAGNSDLYLYTGMASANLLDINGQNAPVSISVAVAAGEKSNNYGNYTVVSAGNSVQMTITATGNPKIMFAGSYHGFLSYLYTFSSTSINPIVLNVPSNTTNEQVIIGETSPYINSINVTGNSGTVTGVRFNNTSPTGVAKILIDGTNYGVSFGVPYTGTTINFTIPSLSVGYHNFQYINDSGASNIVGFQVQSSTSQSPVISGGTFPTTLTIGQTGTWTVNASDPLNGSLSYSVNWGEALPVCPVGYTCVTPAVAKVTSQSSTFTHSYANAGTYTVTFTVTNSSGLSAQTTATVQVTGSILATTTTATTVTASLDASSPVSSIIALSTSTSITQNVPLAVYDLKAQGNNLTLKTIQIKLSIAGIDISTSLSTLFSSIYIKVGSQTYQGSNVGSRIVSFDNLAVSLPVNATVPIVVFANINSSLTNSWDGSSLWNGVSINSILNANGTSSLQVVDSNNNLVMPTGGQIYGNTITLNTISVTPVTTPVVTTAPTKTVQVIVPTTVAPVKTTTSIPATATKTCPTGYNMVLSQCFSTKNIGTKIAPTTTYTCPTNYVLNSSDNTCLSIVGMVDSSFDESNGPVGPDQPELTASIWDSMKSFLGL